MILNFFCAYQDHEDNIISSHKKIIIHYLRIWFWIDFVTIFPFSKLLSSDQAGDNYENGLKLDMNNSNVNKNKFSTFKINHVTRITRIPKLYKLIYMSKFLRVIKNIKSNEPKSRITNIILDKLRLNTTIERLIIFFIAFLILLHLSACIWYLIAKFEDFNPDTWVARLGFLDSSNYDLYLISVYWTLTTVTTVGYGDVSANTIGEKIYNLIIMACGVIMYSFAIGSLTNIVMNFDKHNSIINQKLLILKSIKRDFLIDEEIFDRIRKFIKFDSGRIGKENKDFLENLPNKLKKELSKIIHENVIKKLSFFHSQTIDFISYVAENLYPLKLNYNETVYNMLEVMDESKIGYL